MVVSGSSVLANSLASLAAPYIMLSPAETVMHRILSALWLALRKACRQSSGEAADDLNESGSSRNNLYASVGVISTQSL